MTDATPAPTPENAATLTLVELTEGPAIQATEGTTIPQHLNVLDANGSIVAVYTAAPAPALQARLRINMANRGDAWISEDENTGSIR